MRKPTAFIALMVLFCVYAQVAPAADRPDDAEELSGAMLKTRRLLVVDSSELDDTDSLNRISSGDYEPFLKADLSQSFKSDDHYGASPFDYAKTHEKD